jgi:hypothetical protein
VPSNREISGLIRELNWEISYCLARSFSLVFVGISLKENELWLVIKASGSQTRHRQVGAIFDAANIAIADCVVPMTSQPGQSIDGKAVTLPPVR